MNLMRRDVLATDEIIDVTIEEGNCVTNKFTASRTIFLSDIAII